MTMDDRIEIIQNTFYLLNILYKDYDIRRFMKMIHTMNYDTELIPSNVVDNISYTLKLNDIYIKR